MAREHIETVQQGKVIRMMRPALRFYYDPRLVFRAALRYKATNVMPTPEEIAAIDPQWEQDVSTVLELLDFHEHYNEIPQ